MQQGSEVTILIDRPPSEPAVTSIIQRRRVVALKEAAALCTTMRLMALYCIDQNHVTVDHMETMADTLGMLQRQVEELRIDLASR